MIRLPPTDNRPFEIRASPRPELAAAFEAAGDGAAQAVLIPPAYTRRVIEELMPQLPKEIGGGPSSILTRGICWAAVGIDLPPQLALHAVIKSQDAAAAAALRGKWAEVLRLAGQHEEIRRAVPQFDQVTAVADAQGRGRPAGPHVGSARRPTIDKLVAAIEMPLGKVHRRGPAGRSR